MAREPAKDAADARGKDPSDRAIERPDDAVAGAPEGDGFRAEATRSEASTSQTGASETGAVPEGKLSDDELYGRGRSRPLTPEESRALAREQGELIRSGRASKGQVILDTPLRRAIFIAGLVGIVILALIVSIFR